MKKIMLLVWVFWGVSEYGYSQPNIRQTNDIPVVSLSPTGNDTLYNAWSGAMNATTIGEMDIDRDGENDILVFDRGDRTFSPYLKKATQVGEIKYRFAPQYISFFDTCKCAGWIRVVDYNCDGLPDIFCGNPYSNINVYAQYLTPNNEVRFRRAYNTGFGLHSDQSTFYGEIYAALSDVPAIGDVDGDGDVDYLGFGNLSNYIEWHSNLAMENFNRCDTLVLSVKSFCWGHFVENTNNNSAIIHDTVACQLNGFHPNFRPDPGFPTDDPEERHLGSSLMMLDLNGNNLTDLLLGDTGFRDAYAVYNNAGVPSHAYVDSVQRHFPSYDTPIDILTFPTMSYIDVDNDGVKDLIATPNLREGAENVSAVHFYKNQNQTNDPYFHYTTNGLIQDETIDAGSYSFPTFLDYNRDGKKDILIGNQGIFSRADSIYEANWTLLENIGNDTLPIYSVVEDYMGWLVNNPYPNLKGLSPAAADLDKDGDDDLVVGNFLGTLSYFENQAPTSAGMPANFQLVPNYFGNLDVGANSAPQLFDIDKDSDFDLFIGNDKGYISFYQNNGTAFVPDFSLVTLKWGKVKINDLQGGVGSLGYSRPSFMDLDGDTQPELIVGTIYGQLQIFTNLTTSATDSFPFIGHFQNFDFGSYASPSIAIIDTSRTPVFIVGTQRGGLQLFKKPYHPEPTVSIQTAAGATPFLRLFPNPTSQYFTLQTASSQTEPIDFHIYNISGQDVFASSSVLPTANHYHCVIPPLPNGLYFVKIQYQGKYYTQKLVISSF